MAHFVHYWHHVRSVLWSHGSPGFDVDLYCNTALRRLTILPGLWEQGAVGIPDCAESAYEECWNVKTDWWLLRKRCDTAGHMQESRSTATLWTIPTLVILWGEQYFLGSGSYSDVIQSWAAFFLSDTPSFIGCFNGRWSAVRQYAFDSFNQWRIDYLRPIKWTPAWLGTLPVADLFGFIWKLGSPVVILFWNKSAIVFGYVCVCKHW